MKTNEIANHFALIKCTDKGVSYFVTIATGIFSRLKISYFCVKARPIFHSCLYYEHTFFKYLLNCKTSNITSGAVNSSWFDDSKPYSYMKYKSHTVSPPFSPEQLFGNMDLAHQQKYLKRVTKILLNNSP